MSQNEAPRLRQGANQRQQSHYSRHMVERLSSIHQARRIHTNIMKTAEMPTEMPETFRYIYISIYILECAGAFGNTVAPIIHDTSHDTVHHKGNLSCACFTINLMMR
jgi:hypothetical protein